MLFFRKIIFFEIIFSESRKKGSFIASQFIYGTHHFQ